MAANNLRWSKMPSPSFACSSIIRSTACGGLPWQMLRASSLEGNPARSRKLLTLALTMVGSISNRSRRVSPGSDARNPQPLSPSAGAAGQLLQTAPAPA
eukprot:CAMPEP_0178456524 /NCGR_PEP_ID=MMETSP0689_2-20121128/46522_1 /TAXON_ID=160604 /ORGANISM="Amphidinium massartii, Strain CS-259" /LENGTH=98 /DNA_ID=CAMNT_0020082699 /DNA_START=215 /DNA_END=511 /DNA_ORIENTATION=+